MNERGQAFAEAVILLALTTVVSTLLIRIGLHFFFEMAGDELLEQALICKLQKKSMCLPRLRSQLENLHVSQIKITDISNGSSARIALEYKSGFQFVTQLEKELTLELTVN